jgi:hypothetical protein
VNCINVNCSNKLTEFELKKILPTKFSKYRLCVKCRSMTNITNVECLDCKKPINLSMKIYCSDCAKRRRREFTTKRYFKNKKLVIKKYDLVIEKLVNGDYVSADDFETISSKKHVYGHINYLRKAKKLNIKTYYKID